MKRLLLLFFVAVAQLSFQCDRVTAKPVEAVDIVFDVDVVSLRQNPFFSVLPLQRLVFVESEGSDASPVIQFDGVTRISGAVTCPSSLASIAGNRSGSHGFDFVVRVECDSHERANALYSAVVAENTGAVKSVNGVRYVTSKTNSDVWCSVGRQIVTIGTTGCIEMHPADVMSKDIKACWKELGKPEARILIDSTRIKVLLDDLLTQAFAIDDMELLDMIHGIRMIAIGVDLNSSPIATGIIVSQEQVSQNELKVLIEGHLFTLRKWFRQKAASSNGESEGVRSLMPGLLKSVTTSIRSNSIRMDVPRPEGFTEAIRSLAEDILAAQSEALIKNADASNDGSESLNR